MARKLLGVSRRGAPFSGHLGSSVVVRARFIREPECVNAAMLALYFLVSLLSEGGAFGFWTGVAASEQQSGTQGTKARRKTDSRTFRHI